MDFYISEQEVRGKIPDMTERKKCRPARKTLFRAGLMDFLFFHADQQKMISRHKGRTETFRGSTEFYGAVRRSTEKSDISFLLPLQWFQMRDLGIPCPPPLFSVILRISPYKTSLRFLFALLQMGGVPLRPCCRFAPRPLRCWFRLRRWLRHRPP